MLYIISRDECTKGTGGRVLGTTYTQESGKVNMERKVNKEKSKIINYII